MKWFPLLLILVYVVAGNNYNCKEQKMYKTTGTIEKYDDSLYLVIAPGAQAQIIAEGFEWSEGPLWIEAEKMLLFSDVPKNRIYKWTEKNGAEIYLEPSGYTGNTASKSREPGSNGLTLDRDGNLVLCQHGNRQMAKMEAPLNRPLAAFKTLANTYNNKKFSSPNDCVFNSEGELFFTDPPYGLLTQADNDKEKEIAFNGVYKVKRNAEVVLLVDDITRPNGLAFFPGEQKIIIACSDPATPVWYIYDVAGDALLNGKIFFDASGHDKKWKGLPDGLKINRKGIVFATGPGGVYFFNSSGKKLGLLKLDNAASNCALSADERTLFVTNDMYLLKINLKNS